MRQVGTIVLSIILVLLTLSCGRIPSTAPPRTIVWYVAAPALAGAQAVIRDTSAVDSQGGLVILDTASLRPVLWHAERPGNIEVRRPSPGDARESIVKETGPERIAMFTTWQGSRYHPESIRAITDDSVVLRTTAHRIAEVTLHAGTGIFLDMQGATPDDLPRMLEVTRAVRAAVRERGTSRFGMVVPAADTVAYPTAVIARVADLIVVRLQGEHRSGTAPGPLASPEFIARQLGARATVVGASRLVAELPLFGLRWDRDGSANAITFADARALVMTEAGTFRRDPSSQFLTASGRDGWTVWIPDARTVETMISAAARRGVNRIALSGLPGSDPSLRANPRQVAALRSQTIIRSF